MAVGSRTPGWGSGRGLWPLAGRRVVKKESAKQQGSEEQRYEQSWSSEGGRRLNSQPEMGMKAETHLTRHRGACTRDLSSLNSSWLRAGLSTEPGAAHSWQMEGTETQRKRWRGGQEWGPHPGGSEREQDLQSSLRRLWWVLWGEEETEPPFPWERWKNVRFLSFAVQC